MDESGEIRATAFKEQCDQYYDMIQVGYLFFCGCRIEVFFNTYLTKARYGLNGYL